MIPGIPAIAADAVPVLTPEEMAAVDRALFTACDLDVLQVMEVAGRAVASFARHGLLQGDCRGRSVVALCGPGGNGGDALVAARYLQGWGADVTVWLAIEPKAGSPAAHNLRIARTLGIPEADPAADVTADLVLDGLLGFSGRGAPTGSIADLVTVASGLRAPTLAIDLPTGVDPATGAIHEPCLRATATLTLGLPKSGLVRPTAAPAVGHLYVADIGIPALAFEQAGLTPPRIDWHGDWIAVATSNSDSC